MPDTTCTGDYNCTTSDSRTLSACSSRDEKTFPRQSHNDVSELISHTNYSAPPDPAGEWPVCASCDNDGTLGIKSMPPFPLSEDDCSPIKKKSFPKLINGSGALIKTDALKSIEVTVDDNVVTSNSKTLPACLSRMNDGEELQSCLVLAKKYDSAEKDFDTLVHNSNTTIEIDVSMSPTNHCAQQACLTPSEWQSVNDMPRVNRVPFTNQTQRITPLKERVKKNKLPVHANFAKLSKSGGFKRDANENSCSSNSSTSSTTFSVSKYGSEERRIHFVDLDSKLSPNNMLQVQADLHLNTGTFPSEVIDCDLEEITCNYSDISSHDEQQIYDVIDSESQSHEAVNEDECDLSDNTFQDIAVVVKQSGYRDCDKDKNRDNGSDSDSDSDNDLGQFYTPSPLLKSVDKIIASSPVLSSSSLGYISSYPLIGRSARARVQKKA